MKKSLRCLLCLLFLLFISARLNPTNINVYDIELASLSNAASQTTREQVGGDYSHTYVKNEQADVKIYRPSIFNEIRNKLALPDSIYIHNLLPNRLICVANSDSKSGQRFWISNDGLIVIKTIKHYELKNLQSILNNYHYHIINNDYCSIASVLGIYRVKLKGHWFSKYYLVTRNVFPLLGEKDMFIYKKYDLKGSTLGRTASSKSSVEKDVSNIYLNIDS